MNQPEIVHPKLMESLEDKFLTKRIDIQEFTTSAGKYNYQTKAWTDKYTNVKCSIGPDTEEEQKQENKTIRQTRLRVLLDKTYSVDETMRVVYNGENYDILSGSENGMTGTKTSLVIRKSEV